MRLPKTVLDVVRGASGAAMALAIGCSSSHGGELRAEPAARLSPVVAIAPPAVAVPLPTAPVAIAPAPVATLEALPPSPPAATPVLAATPTTHHRRHRAAQQPGLIGAQPDIDPIIMANCGRG